MREVRNATARLSLRVRRLQACRESAIGIGIELALRPPEEEEPVDWCHSQSVKRLWCLNAKSSREAAASNAERGQQVLFWRRQAASLASFRSACPWRY